MSSASPEAIGGTSNETLDQLLQSGAPESPALIPAEHGATAGYQQLRYETMTLAGRLAHLGVGRGTRVAVVIKDGPLFLRTLFALTTLGAAVSPLNPAYKRDEYRFYLDDLQPEMLLAPVGELDQLREASGESVRVVDVEDRSGVPILSESGRVADGQAVFEAAQPDDVALLLHTSGTTSRPKQVPLTQRNLMASARTIAHFYALRADDISYCTMPLFHVHGLVASAFSAFAAGGSVVVPRRFAPSTFWRHVRTHGVTWFSAGPTLHQMILERSDGEGPPTSLRFARSCSSALSPALMARIEEALGVPVVEAYGMTEASHQMASNPLPPAQRKPGTVGVSTGVEIRIMDRSGKTLHAGERGEVVIRGPGVTSGYLNDLGANAECFSRGWFRTGDRGSIDSDGYLRLEGRLKEMILRGGENISPYEIEEVLLSHPAVEDAICFGVDDEKYGERVGAAVVFRHGGQESELIDYCRARLAAFKVPDKIHVLQTIPRTATGKVQRKRVGQALSESAR